MLLLLSFGGSSCDVAGAPAVNGGWYGDVGGDAVGVDVVGGIYIGASAVDVIGVVGYVFGVDVVSHVVGIGHSIAYNDGGMDVWLWC